MPAARLALFGVQRTPFWGQTCPNTSESGPKRYPIAFHPATTAAGLDTAPQGGPWACFWRFWAILGGNFTRDPGGPIWGSTDTVLGANGSKHGQKRTQTLPNCILSINNGNRTWHGAPWRHQGPFLAFLGHFWAQNFSKCPGPQNRPKYHQIAVSGRWGSDRKKYCIQKSCGKPSRIAW